MKYKYLFFIIFILCSCGTSETKPQTPTEPASTLPAITTEEETEESESEQIEITTEEIIIEENKEQEALDIINTIRNEHGLSSLSWDDELYKVAQIRSQECSRV